MELGGDPSKTMLPLVLLQRPLFTAQSPGVQILPNVKITMGLTATTVFSDKLSGCQCICISISIILYIIYIYLKISTQAFPRNGRLPSIQFGAMSRQELENILFCPFSYF
jgi:hypothetical protein